MKDVELKIKGMHCKSCTMIIGDALKEVPGVKDAHVDLQKATAKVSFDETKADVKKLIDAVNGEGYNASEK